MTFTNLTKKLAVIILTFLISLKSYSQTNATVFVSQDGFVSFKLTKESFYLYISQSGDITGYGAFGNGDIKYDYNSRVIQIGTTKISYDFKGRPNAIGNTSIHYDFYQDRVDKIGSIDIHYDFYQDRIDKFDNLTIHYGFYDNKVDKVGNATIKYNFQGFVEKIDDNDGIIVFKPKLEVAEK
jgi:hypothetical protein